ncbi:hypothetical protein NDU88_010260 [Pleurodeles waltl]|uniref:Uncharacterized protein n=1 Tax=Pleurodeles waltl TaxID=8319 RepID=A0AAV7S071_PLEWA|nr:hypothetical protein NDU88_010260 [Pleurodeles waltl]
MSHRYVDESVASAWDAESQAHLGAAMAGPSHAANVPHGGGNGSVPNTSTGPIPIATQPQSPTPGQPSAFEQQALNDMA